MRRPVIGVLAFACVLAGGWLLAAYAGEARAGDLSGPAVRVTEGPLDWQPALSPDGRHLAYLTLTNYDEVKTYKTRNCLTVLDLDSGQGKVLAEEIPNRSELGLIPPRLRWSPDSRELICVVNCDPWGRGAFSLWRIEPESMALSKSPVYDANSYYQMRAELAPDGRSIASQFSDHRPHQVDDAHCEPVHIVSPDGTEVRTEVVYKELFASPDGRYMVGVRASRRELHELGADGSKVRTICQFAPEGRYVHLLNFCGTTGSVLLTIGPQSIWRTPDKENPKHWQHVLVDLATGAITPLAVEAAPGDVIALAEPGAILCCHGAGPLTIHHAISGRTEALEVTGPGWGQASPSPRSPWAVVKLKDRGTAIINWQTRQAVSPQGEQWQTLSFPLSWSLDGRLFAFTSDAGELEIARIVVLCEPWMRAFRTGAIWIARPASLAEEALGE